MNSLKLICAAALLTLDLPASGALLKVDQKIHGMDCAPCAYGTEKGLKKLPGVKDVSVSLNQGNAVVDLKPENKVTMKEIRQIIERAGFTPVEARVEVAGKLERDGDQSWLVTESGSRFKLVAEGEGKAGLEKQGQEAVVKGVVPEGKVDQIRVESVSAPKGDERAD